MLLQRHASKACARKMLALSRPKIAVTVSIIVVVHTPRRQGTARPLHSQNDSVTRAEFEVGLMIPGNRSAHARVAAGQAIPAFALSETEAGSDVGAMQTTARQDGDGWVIDGEKTWISNAGLADFYVVFCRLPEAGEKGFGCFLVEASNPGLKVTARIDVLAPHPLGTITFQDCRVPEDALIGEPGKGLKVALATLDVFRSTVGAAALGFARRALDEALAWTRDRRAFGKNLVDYQLTQARLADMAVEVDASALLVYRAAWTRDSGAERITREAAMAKLFATEAAQRVIDGAVQLLGGRGVVAGSPVERLYREVRALRIYEGTSEIQRLVIAGQIFAGAAGAAGKTE